MPKTKKIPSLFVLALIVLIFILTILACKHLYGESGEPYPNQPADISSTAPTDNENFESARAKILQNLSPSEQAEILKIRAEIEARDKRDTVRVTKAMNNKDKALCAEMEDETRAKECFDMVAHIIAVEAVDLELCNQIVNETEQTRCRSEINFFKALIEDNPDFCGKVEFEDAQARCLEAFEE